MKINFHPTNYKLNSLVQTISEIISQTYIDNHLACLIDNYHPSLRGSRLSLKGSGVLDLNQRLPTPKVGVIDQTSLTPDVLITFGKFKSCSQKIFVPNSKLNCHLSFLTDKNHSTTHDLTCQAWTFLKWKFEHVENLGLEWLASNQHLLTYIARRFNAIKLHRFNENENQDSSAQIYFWRAFMVLPHVLRIWRPSF